MVPHLKLCAGGSRKRLHHGFKQRVSRAQAVTTQLANCGSSRTLVYLEGDATMRTYNDADGKKQSALNLVQTKVDVLKRPYPKEGESDDGPTGV